MAQKQSEAIRGTEKEFLELFGRLCYSRSSWQVWSDLMAAISCSISNAVDRSPEHFESREKEYAQCIERLGSLDIPAKLFGIIVTALESNPEQDFLGKMYMGLNLGNHWKGQFFTPYSLCRCMSEISCGELDRRIEENGYVSICDPACGAGATLIAAANTMKLAKHNFQNHVLFVGQDIDRITGMMCYIQLSLLGCSGYVCIGNTLTSPVTGHPLFPNENAGQELWYTPIFYSDVWTTRRMLKLIGGMSVTAANKNAVGKEHFYMFFDFEKEANMEEEKRIGQEFDITTSVETDKEQEKTYDLESGACTEDDVRIRAREKLENELKEERKANHSQNDLATIEKVIGYLMDRCGEDCGLSEDVLQEHKTWKNCFKVVYSMAKKQTTRQMCWVDDEVVYEWAEDYYHKDDKAEEEARAKKEAEAKAKREKAAAEKKAESDDKPEKKEDMGQPVSEPAREKTETEQEQPKPKKNSKDMDGQMDLFSLMGI